MSWKFALMAVAGGLLLEPRVLCAEEEAPATTSLQETKKDEIPPSSPPPPVATPVTDPPPSPAELEAFAKRDFDRGVELLQEGKEAQALVSFTDFMRRYPDHRWKADAQYYLGEILFRQRKFGEALEEYLKVKTLGAHGSKLPLAFVRIGECQKRLGHVLEATIEWNAVLRKFPNTEAAQQAQILLKGLL